MTSPAAEADRLSPTTHRGRSPRDGPLRTRPRTRYDSTRPPLPARPPLRRPTPCGAYAAVACWWSAQRWVDHVERVYRRHYLLLRPRLVGITGGGVSLSTVLAVATTHAGAADFSTGRNSWPVIGDTGGPTGITAATGLGARTISRARTFLRLAGLATEVQAGRHRSLTERLQSWERGDTARGWTAVYALHHTSTHPVDNLPAIRPGHRPDGTPPRSGSFSPSPLEESVVSTDTKTKHGGASRPAPTRKGHRRGRRAVPDPRGLLLATRWRAHPDSPCWAQFSTPTTWAALLALPAHHDWTARDLHALLDTHARSGRQVLTHPRNPIGYLSWLLSRIDLADRPCAYADAREAEELAAARQRVAEAPLRRAQHHQARQEAITALNGAARTEALAIAATAAQRAHHNREHRSPGR